MIKRLCIARLLVTIVISGFGFSEACWAVDAYLGSDAGGEATLYKISFTSFDDVTLGSITTFPRIPGAEFTALALKPGTSLLYCFIGANLCIYDLTSGAISKVTAPGEKIEFFNEPAIFSPSGRLLYARAHSDTGERGLIMDSQSFAVKGSVRARNHGGYLRAVTFAPDETALWIGKEDSVISVGAALDGDVDLEDQSASGTVLAEITTNVAGTPSRLSLQGDKLLVFEEKRDSEVKAQTTVVTVISEGIYSRAELHGIALAGDVHDHSFYSYDPISESLLVQDNNGMLQKTVGASLTNLLDKGQLEVVQTDSGIPAYRFGGTQADAYPTFSSGFMSPDGQFAILVYDAGNRIGSFVAIVEISSGGVSSALRVGTVDGGISNVVYAE